MAGLIERQNGRGLKRLSVAKITGSGVVSVDVAGRDAIELTLDGDLTGLTWSGWHASTDLHQKVLVKVLQDATGGHAFDPALVAGAWLDGTPPAPLPTTASATVIVFTATTNDAGVTVDLERAGRVDDTNSTKVYPHLMASDAVNSVAIQADFDGGLSKLGGSIRTARYFGDGPSFGGADYTIVAAGTGTADGGSYIDFTGFQLEASFSDGVDVMQFGTRANGVQDETARIQAALDAHLRVKFGGIGLTFPVSGTLTLRSGHQLDLSSATIEQTTANTRTILLPAAVDDVIIKNGHIAGLGTDRTDAPGLLSLPVGIYGLGGSSLTIRDVRFSNHGGSAVHVNGYTDLALYRNRVTGPGGYTVLTSIGGRGLVFTDCDDVTCSGNRVADVSIGIESESGNRRVVVSDNIIDRCGGQHGLYLGSGHEVLTVSGNVIENIALQGIKVQNNDDIFPGLSATSITIGGNAIRNVGSHGILVINTKTGTAVEGFDTLSIVGNSIDAITGDDGINVDLVNGFTISGNTISNITEGDGVHITRSTVGLVSDNVVNGSGRNGVRIGGDTDHVRVIDNTFRNPANNNTVGGVLAAVESYGVYAPQATTTNVDIISNHISADNGKMRYGMFIASDVSQASWRVVDNWVEGAFEYGARFAAPVTNLLDLRDNHFDGVIAPTLNQPTDSQRGNTGREFYGTGVPTVGAWLRGDILWESTPAAGSAKAWVCVAGGTPGTWVDLANTVGATATGGVADWDDVTNTVDGGGLTLLASTAANGPTGVLSGRFWHPFNFEFGTAKDGTGQLTQLAVPYGNQISQDAGMWMRGRFAGVWTAWTRVDGGTAAHTASITATAAQTIFPFTGHGKATATPSVEVFVTPLATGVQQRLMDGVTYYAGATPTDDVTVELVTGLQVGDIMTVKVSA